MRRNAKFEGRPGKADVTNHHGNGIYGAMENRRGKESRESQTRIESDGQKMWGSVRIVQAPAILRFLELKNKIIWNNFIVICVAASSILNEILNIDYFLSCLPFHSFTLSRFHPHTCIKMWVHFRWSKIYWTNYPPKKKSRLSQTRRTQSKYNMSTCYIYIRYVKWLLCKGTWETQPLARGLIQSFELCLVPAFAHC